MAVPDYQSLMLPIMKLAADGQEHTSRSVVEQLAEALQLSEDDKRKLLPSGLQAQFDNRVGWAITYLSKAGLLTRTGRAKFKITEKGQEVLATNPDRIDTKYLRQFSSFQDFIKPSSSNDVDNNEDAAEATTETPEESLEASYQQLQQNLANELLEQIKGGSSTFFERLVVDLLVAMGYGGSRADAGRAVGKAGDGGIDGIIKEDRLGLDVIYLQAKRWEGTVGRPTVQAFAGSLDGYRAKRGVLITTSQFSPEAREYVNRIEKRIVLIDGEQLGQLMIEYGVGVTEVARYTVKKMDSDYFGEA